MRVLHHNRSRRISSIIRAIILFVIVVVMCWAAGTAAHDVVAIQNRLDIAWRGSADYAISWVSANTELRPVLPPDCKKKVPLEDNYELWACDRSLEGRTVEIEQLPVSDAEVLVRIDHGGGQVQVELLSGRNHHFAVKERQATSGWQAAGTYFVLGVEHILMGFDHLLFVFGLLLILSGWKLLALAITAFTVAHSITLALSVLGIIRVPVAPVEAVIALSIVFLATEYARQLRGFQGWTSRKPWLVSFAVGLLHGLGFASALREVGLPEDEIPVALVMFNVGVEAGQLAFVAAALPLMLFASARLGKEQPWLRLAAAYSIGGVAAFWFIERTAAVF